MRSKVLARLLRMGLPTAVVWCGALSAQTGSLTQPATANINNINRPFLIFDDSLTRAANTLLVTPVQTAADETLVKIDQAASVGLDLRADQRPRPLLDIALTLVTARLDLLRPAVEPILRSRGVPIGMEAVIVVESGGNSLAFSPKGARGLWQLMPDTARRYGLRVDEIQDDRLDLFKSTDAAARYLHDLYAQFGDWKLALAAYNTGEGNLGSAILRAHTQDFDQLTNLRMLPLETRNYVPRVLDLAGFMGEAPILKEQQRPSNTNIVFAGSNR